MRVQLPLTGQAFELEATPLGRGGEAGIFVVTGRPEVVAKIYHKPTTEHAEKLAAMLAAPPADPMARTGHASIAWPTEMLVSCGADSHFVGFLMPRIEQAYGINEYYIPKTRQQRCPGFHYGYLMRTARNLAAAVRAVHDKGYVVGDLSGSNLLATKQALVTLIDTDSFQIRAGAETFRCRVGTPEFTPPELHGARFSEIDRGPEHDAFGLGVVIFQLLMQGTHPFAGIFTGKGEPRPIPRRILSGHWPYVRGRDVPYRPSPHAPAWETLPPVLQALFLLCFEEGHGRPACRPDSREWQRALEDCEKELTPCAANSQHLYYRGLATCPWCALGKLQKRDPFPSLEALRNGASGSLPSMQGVSGKPNGGSGSRSQVLPAILVDPAPPLLSRARLFWGGSVAAFLVAAFVIGWGTWKLTHHSHAATPTPVAKATGVVGPEHHAVQPEPPPNAERPPAPEEPDPPDPVPVPEVAPPEIQHPAITALAISPDGKQVLTGGSDNGARLWNMTTGKEVASFEGHSQPVTAVAFSADGKQIATGSADTSVRLWDRASGKELQRLQGHQQTVTCVAFTRDGKTVVSGSADRSWRSWDASLGALRVSVTAHQAAIICLAISPSGLLVASGGADNEISVRDLATGREIRHLAKHTHDVRAVAFTTDGQELVSGSTDSTVRLWNVATGAEVRQFDGFTGCVALNVVDRQRVAATFKDGITRLFNLGTGQETASIKGPKAGATDAVVAGGRQLVIASDDKRLHLRNLTATTPKGDGVGVEMVCFRGHGEAVTAVGMGPAGEWVVSASAGDHTLRLWDPETGALKRIFSGVTTSLSWADFSQDGRRALTLHPNSIMHAWDAENGRQAAPINRRGRSAAVPVRVATLTPDGLHAVTLSVEGLTYWDLTRRMPAGSIPRRILNAVDLDQPAILSASGQYALLRETNGLAIRNLINGQVHFRVPGSDLEALALASDASRLCCHAAKELSLWNVKAKEQTKLPWDVDSSAVCAAFSTDHRHLLVGGSDGAIRLWRVASGKLVRLYRGHEGQVRCLRFSSDGRFAVSGGADATVRTWEMPEDVHVKAGN